MNDVIKTQYEVLCILQSILDETLKCKDELDTIIEDENKPIDI